MSRELPCQRSGACRFWMRGSLITFMHISVQPNSKFSHLWSKYCSLNGQIAINIWLKILTLGLVWSSVKIRQIPLRSFTDAYLELCMKGASKFFVLPAKSMLQVLKPPEFHEGKSRTILNTYSTHTTGVISLYYL